MIGVNTSIFKSAGRKLVNLLGTLKDRATYYENGTNSTAEKNRIDDLGVLDKATILLTPTATSDARVHSVKTYTGDDYVVGGDFSDFSTDWTTNTATESGGVVTIPNNGYIFQSISFPNDGTVRIRVEGSGTVKYRLGVSSPSDAFITKTLPFTAYEDLNSTDVRIQLNNTSGSDATVTNVSVINVSSDFDFDRASSATRINSSSLVQDMQSITDSELVLNGDFEELSDNYIINPTFDTSIPFGTNGSGWVTIDTSSDNGTIEFFNGGIRMQRIGSNLKRLRAVLSGGSQAVIPSTVETYKIQYEVISATDDNSLSSIYLGGVSVQVGSSNTTVGVHTIYGESGGSNGIIQFQPLNNKEVVLDNISVKQVDPNDRWTKGTGWSIENGVASIDGSQSTNSDLQQSFTTETSKQYKITYTISNYSGTGNILVRINSGNTTTAQSGNGTFTEVLTGAGGNTIRLRANADFIGTVDNVSVKDITFSTDVDLARINYDSNGENGHILLEPTSTNLVTYSEDFSEWTNTASETTDTANSATSPSGESNATKLQEANSSNSFHRLSKTISLSSATDYSLSIFAKKGTLSNMQLMLLNTSDSKMFSKVFDLENGTLGETLTSGAGESLTDSKIEDIGNGWYRCSIVGQLSTTPNTFRINLANASTGNTTSNGMVKYTGDGNGNIYIYGAQLEALSYPTSYIPTLTGSTVTRAVETLAGSGNSTLINSTEGSLYVDTAALNSSPGSQITISLSGDNANDRILIYANSGGGKWLSQFRKDSSSYVTIDKSATISNQSKVALAWESGRYVMFVDGVKATNYGTGSETTSTTFDAGDLKSLQFSPNKGATGNYYYGKVKAIAVFNEALSDTELQNLTS